MIVDTSKQRWCWALYEGPQNCGSVLRFESELIGIVFDEEIARRFVANADSLFPRRFHRLPLLDEGDV
jgi:hypothetical protein